MSRQNCWFKIMGAWCKNNLKFWLHIDHVPIFFASFIANLDFKIHYTCFMSIILAGIICGEPTRLVLSADILSVSSSSFALKRANDKKLSFWNSLQRLIYNTSVDNTNWWFSLLCNQNLNQNCWMPDTKRVSYCRIFIKKLFTQVQVCRVFHS